MPNDQIILYFKGLNSADAVREVAESLLGVEGVSDVEIDDEKGSATVKIVEGIDVRSDDLIKSLSEIGGVEVTRIVPTPELSPIRPPL